MKVLYVNQNINHHLFPFFEELQKIYGKTNVIYAVQNVSEEWRINMGFNKIEVDNAILPINNNWNKFEALFYEADVVLCCVRDYWRLMEERLKKDKLTFYFSERWFKQGFGKFRLFSLHFLFLVLKFRRLSKYNQFYYLAQGLTAAKDLNSIGIGIGKTLNFGYFPPIESKKTECRIKLPTNKINILWCGRLISHKRVDLLAKAYIELAKKYGHIHLTIVGDGPIKTKILNMLGRGSCDNRFSIYNFLPNCEVRNLMSQADIYVLPSDGWEGWGVVLNEAMIEKCAVIAGSEIGGAQSMFDDFGGIIFKSESWKDLMNKIECLVTSIDILERQKHSVYQLVTEKWCAPIAAKRFNQIVECIFSGENVSIFKSGPLSLI